MHTAAIRLCQEKTITRTEDFVFYFFEMKSIGLAHLKMNVSKELLSSNNVK